MTHIRIDWKQAIIRSFLKKNFLILGTLIAISLSISLSTLTSLEYTGRNWAMAMFSAISIEILVIVIGTRFLIEEKLKGIKLLHLENRIMSSGDKVFITKYNQYLASAEELARGHYVIESLDVIYLDDINHIELLQNGDTVYSTCPFIYESGKVEDFFSRTSYQSLCDAYIRAADRGVKIERVFIEFIKGKSRSLYNITIKKHFLQLISAGIIVKIFHNNLRAPVWKEVPDFMLINHDQKVSVGHMVNSEVYRVDVYLNNKEVASRYQKQKSILDLNSISVDQLENI